MIKVFLTDVLEIIGLLIVAVLLMCVTLPVLAIARLAQWIVFDGPMKLSEYVYWRWQIQRQRRY